MTIPSATRVSAFLAGLSLGALSALIDVSAERGWLTQSADSPEVFPLLAIYFFITAVVFVIGIRNIAPPELKTSIPFIYFPTTREGVQVVLRIWGRMLIWFIGAGAGMMLLGLLS